LQQSQQQKSYIYHLLYHSVISSTEYDISNDNQMTS